MEKNISRNIKLSKRVFEYLTSSSFLTESQLYILNEAKRKGNGSREFNLTPNDAEQFRDSFTIELARSGFDEMYGLNDVGEILESLIDKFSAPASPAR